MDYFEHLNDASLQTKYLPDGTHWWSIDGVNWYPVPEPIYHKDGGDE